MKINQKFILSTICCLLVSSNYSTTSAATTMHNNAAAKPNVPTRVASASPKPNVSTRVTSASPNQASVVEANFEKFLHELAKNPQNFPGYAAVTPQGDLNVVYYSFTFMENVEKAAENSAIGKALLEACPKLNNGYGVGEVNAGRIAEKFFNENPQFVRGMPKVGDMVFNIATRKNDRKATEQYIKQEREHYARKVGGWMNEVLRGEFKEETKGKSRTWPLYLKNLAKNKAALGW